MSPTIQSPAPVFSVTALIDGSFKEVSLGDYLGRCDFTFVCPTEILAFNDALPEFSRLNTTVLAISTDSEYSHHAAGGLGPDLRIPLLADRNMRVAREYGCLIEDKGITFRASYLIDPKGTLRCGSLLHGFTMNDLPVGRSVDEALRLVQAFQFTDAHGEVWGSKTIRADPLAKLDYFAATADGTHENGKANGTKRARMDTE
ncbi:2-cysteine peroxiredoxin [Lactarius pseudohatsudake]|nr:2-cysteine peroxiredoxin [Lactarius pseudohatsudake]